MAALFENEAGSDPTALSHVISHAVNMVEQWWNQGKYTSTRGNLYAGMAANSRWWGSNWGDARSVTPSVEAIMMVEDVIERGNRTLPPYVIEYDGFSEMYQMYDSQIRYLTIDGHTASNAADAKVICDNAVSGSSHVLGSYGGEGTFYCYDTDGINGNVFYYDEAYKAALGY